MSENASTKKEASSVKGGDHTVEKIGGTSIARTDVVVDAIVLGDREESELYNRIFVLSAYVGITDKLLEHKKTGDPGIFSLFTSSESEWAWGDAMTRLTTDMMETNARILGEHPECNMADGFVRERIEGVRNCLIDLHRLCSYGHFRLEEQLLSVREMLASLGEAHSAYNTTLLLRQRGVNATFIDLTGWRDEEQPTLDRRIQRAFESVDLKREMPIVTGYAQCREGLMGTFDRGYTEVTFSRIAVLTQAREAIIHKGFHLSSSDPLVVGEDKVRVIGHTNYDVTDQLSNMGTEAIHPNAAKGLRQAGIPLRVKNTFEPRAPGTLIRDEEASGEAQVEIVTGLPGIYAVEFFEQEMVRVKGFDHAILDSLTRYKLRIISKDSNANTITHYVDANLERVRQFIEDLERQFPMARITGRRVAFISVIGRNLRIPRLFERAVVALGEAGIEVLAAHLLIRRVDLQFVVGEADYEPAIRTLHAALMEQDEPRCGVPVDPKEAVSTETAECASEG